MSRRKRIHLLLVVPVVLLAAVVPSGAAASRPFTVSGLALASSGTLTFESELTAASSSTACPAGTPLSLECFARTGTGIVRGLGNVQESYAHFLQGLPAGCENPIDQVRVLPTTARFTVPGKGEIELRLGGTGCLFRSNTSLRAEEAFTITGGSGRYVGASGAGTIAQAGPLSGPGGTDTWAGTLVVPGLNFDLTPPTLSGAADIVVRAPKGAKRVRVNFHLTAIDDVDGRLNVSCRPKTGSRFKLGRTTVTCSTTDTSGNTQTAKFAVVVKRSK